jgi:hypothetical protein
LRQRKWAAADSKINIRELALNMDEESLIAADDVGMDFNDLRKFDDWILANPKYLD